MMFFEKITPEKIFLKYQKDIQLSFQNAYVPDYSIDTFLYKECQNKIAEIQYKIPEHIIDYVAFDLMADDFYTTHRPLLIYKHKFLYLTLNYVESYKNFLKGSF